MGLPSANYIYKQFIYIHRMIAFLVGFGLELFHYMSIPLFTLTFISGLYLRVFTNALMDPWATKRCPRCHAVSLLCCHFPKAVKCLNNVGFVFDISF